MKRRLIHERPSDNTAILLLSGWFCWSEHPCTHSRVKPALQTWRIHDVASTVAAWFISMAEFTLRVPSKSCIILVGEGTCPGCGRLATCDLVRPFRNDSILLHATADILQLFLRCVPKALKSIPLSQLSRVDISWNFKPLSRPSKAESLGQRGIVVANPHKGDGIPAVRSGWRIFERILRTENGLR